MGAVPAAVAVDEAVVALVERNTLMPTTTTIAWIDTNDCGQSYHELVRDEDSRVHVLHVNGRECDECEFEVTSDD